ncbi:c-type cytochrome [Novosphingobium mangrovi (ex Hu et al. 2023)]|uniref:Cytochrome c n=1 Tax=Novosphingobium mangrovi (ex Hu et al. 2023) TaxID=2930094 RepID=A0ABT0AB95_9SPHN|nr:cytochrome c [Novosphingobium mangrovi (ex Hu et al. 2023)]MCJ1960466.1 cytochrome c [Novosphingobium mangrovi (ex Hu et al. 2023)]
MPTIPHLLLATTGLALATLASALPAQGSPPAQQEVARGKAVFARHCAACHGRGPGDDGSAHLPGTAALAARYQGSLPGALEERKDLDAETLLYFVRHGSGPMPMFRKTEVSDADIGSIAAYLAASAASVRK